MLSIILFQTSHITKTKSMAEYPVNVSIQVINTAQKSVSMINMCIDVSVFLFIYL